MRVLMAAGLVVVLAIAALLLYVGWFMRRTVSDPTHVSVHLKPSGDRTIEIEIAVTGGSSPLAVTEISMTRTLRDQLGIAPPAGFVAEALPLTSEEQRDPEAVARAAEFNREKVRYVGSANVPANGTAVLVFRAERKGAADGLIELQHERKVGMGGSIGFASVRLD